jgi:hypothetical protein
VATLAIQTIVNAGITPAYVPAAAGGDKVIPGPGSYVHVKNGGGSSVTVTLVTPGTVDGTLAVGDRAVVVAAGAESKIAVGNLYRDPADGLASITYSAVTTVSVGSFRAPVSD